MDKDTVFLFKAYPVLLMASARQQLCFILFSKCNCLFLPDPVTMQGQTILCHQKQINFVTEINMYLNAFSSFSGKKNKSQLHKEICGEKHVSAH